MTKPKHHKSIYGKTKAADIDSIVRISDFTNHYLKAKKLAMIEFDETKQAAMAYCKEMEFVRTAESYSQENEIHTSLYPAWIDMVVNPMIRDLEDRFPGIEVFRSEPSELNFMCSLLLRGNVESETDDLFKIQFKIELIQKTNDDDQLTLSWVEADEVYGISSIVEAMKQTDSFSSLWYSNELIDKPLRFAEKQGLVFRLSTTQVGWTEAGYKVAKEHIQSHLDSIVRLSDFTNRYLEAKKLAITRFNEANTYTAWIGRVVNPMIHDLEDRLPGIEVFRSVPLGSDPSGLDFGCSLLLRVNTKSEVDNVFKIQFKIELDQKTNDDDQLTLSWVETDEIYGIDSMFKAMNLTRSEPAWWLDKAIDNPLRFGEKQGLVFRPSTTQVDWTDAGFKVVKDHIQKHLQKMLELDAMEFGKNMEGFYGVIPDGQNLPDDFMPVVGSQLDKDIKDMADDFISCIAIHVNINNDKPFRVIYVQTLSQPGTETSGQWAHTPQESYDSLSRILATQTDEGDEPSQS